MPILPAALSFILWSFGIALCLIGVFIRLGLVVSPVTPKWAGMLHCGLGLGLLGLAYLVRHTR